MIASQRTFGARMQRSQIESEIQITTQMVQSEMRNKKRKLEEHISLGICVSQVRQHISLGICVSQVGEHISLGICVAQVGKLPYKKEYAGHD